jgi:hypothetical protein
MLVFLCPKGTLTELRVAMVVAGINYSRKTTTTTTTPCCCLRFCYCIVVVCLLSFILLSVGFGEEIMRHQLQKPTGFFQTGFEFGEGEVGKAGGTLIVPAKKLVKINSTLKTSFTCCR